MINEAIKSTPWDAKVFEIDTYELHDASDRVLAQIQNIPGHFTVKVEPLETKQHLHKYGFYYCDTLLKPYCRRKEFHSFVDERISLSEDTKLDDLLAVSDGVYRHGRFHRDFNLGKLEAHKRYNQWLSQLYDKKQVWGLLYQDELAGIFASEDGHILLQALKKEFQGRGLGKYFWSTGCRELFNQGFDELSTSVSACNLAVVNVVASLGFKFRKAVDVYHKYNPDKT